MTAPRAKVRIPDVVADFASYYEKHCDWARLHIVMDDGNYERHHAEFCVEVSDQEGDVEGARLARILCDMSDSQRRRLPRKVAEYRARERTFGDVCREARARGLSVLWWAHIWERREPTPLTDSYIARNEKNSHTMAHWTLDGRNRIVAILRRDGRRLFVARAL